jgi:predicted nucleic acid-binding protein
MANSFMSTPLVALPDEDLESLWDAMILAAAQSSGARELISEDLNAGQDCNGIRVVNPFAGTGL